MSLTLNDLIGRFGGELSGDGTCRVTGLAPLDKAVAGQIAFLSNPLYLSQVSESKASAVILSRQDFDKLADVRAQGGRNWIVAANPYAYFARVAQVFAASAQPPAMPGIHPTAVVDPQAKVAASASIGPHAIVEAGAVIGEGVRIAGHAFVGRQSTIGAGTILYPNVTVYHGCRIGQRCIVHAGAVIGSDGFGFAPDFGADGGEWVKIPQVGGVLVEDDVEIGASTTIDRGAMADTVIERGCKIDNQVQIGHNVSVGAYTVIAGCAGIAGSTTIGRHCMIGGAVGISGHVTIGDKVIITAKSGVSKSILQPGIYTSAFPAIPNAEWNKNAAIMRNLDKMRDRLRELEATVKALQSK